MSEQPKQIRLERICPSCGEPFWDVRPDNGLYFCGPCNRWATPRYRIKESEAPPSMIVIDLAGPAGNAFMLMAQVAKWAEQLGESAEDTNILIATMQSGTYEDLLFHMKDWCEAHHIDVIFENGEDDEDND